MIRKIVKIDSDKCNGCGACVTACHEGAIAMIDGKAALIRDDYCDGLGDCLPACPAGAISFEEREALSYDHEAVMAKMREKLGENMAGGLDETSDGRPDGTKAGRLDGTKAGRLDGTKAGNPAGQTAGGLDAERPLPCSGESFLSQWPVQIKLVPVRAPYFNGANLLVAADCTAFAYGNFHQDFIRGHVTLIGCPKLDSVDYSEKLTEIFRQNEITGITVARMEVPCCGGIEYAVKKAVEASGKNIPLQIRTISIQGKILE